jgi:hypothetical protein
MPRYADTMTLLAARTAFFEHSRLGADGGYNARWVRIDAKPFPLFFPNMRRRVEAAKLHDLHHVATEYATDWRGEAEIAAWEIGGGCGPYGWAWVLNLGAFAVGLLLAPQRVFQAFVRGRHARNLYHGGLADAALGDVTVGTLRAQLGVHSGIESAHPSDVLAFAAWCGITAAFNGGAIAVALAAIWMLWLRPRR